MLRGRRAHARAETGRHHDRAEAPRRPFEGTWLGRQDSNLGSRDQNPLPYHLATPQSEAHLAIRGPSTTGRATQRASRVTRALEAARCRFARVVEEPVDDRAGAGDVGAERAERLELAARAVTTRGRSREASRGPARCFTCSSAREELRPALLEPGGTVALVERGGRSPPSSPSRAVREHEQSTT